ncbi:Flagellar biosynthesis protein, FliO [Sporobacter termitidis DSM 10068]|uniref:Flagellar protein n=1 Tax=Sporobacter termitidis DSM 10068 TaxID=1123282 RepID=A0A1M5W7M8_9FIRM|nr:flagellar biosynthetic protein FliO [Sporobacter termitidis]SHH83487.1 Flagellar biosynthesis protein, FliO [Sporobacter termitidis DSM 10068]
MNTFWDYVQAIVIIAAVIFAAYYVTKLVAKTGGGGFRRSSGIKLIGSQSLGRDKSVTIVEIGQFHYILGVSAQRVELLDKLDKSESGLKKEEPSASLPSFGESFKEELNKRFNRQKKDD